MTDIPPGPRDLAAMHRRAADRLTMIRLRLSRTVSELVKDSSQPWVEGLHDRWVDEVYPRIGSITREIRAGQHRLERSALAEERARGRRMGGYQGAGFLGRGDRARDQVQEVIAFRGQVSGATIGGFPLGTGRTAPAMPHASEILGEGTPVYEDD